MNKLFKTSEVLALTVMSRSKFDQWNYRNLIEAAQPSKGAGYPAKFDWSNIIQIYLTEILSEAGLDLRRSARAAKTAVSIGGKVLINIKSLDARSYDSTIKPFDLLVDLEQLSTSLRTTATELDII